MSVLLEVINNLFNHLVLLAEKGGFSLACYMHVKTCALINSIDIPSKWFNGDNIIAICI